jgi:hypothetical protein
MIYGGADAPSTQGSGKNPGVCGDHSPDKGVRGSISID